MRTKFSAAVVLIFVALFLSHTAWAQILPESAPAGFKPRSIAVSPNGDHTIVTSDGSHFISEFYGTGAQDPAHIDVQSRSWDVTFIDDYLAVVSLLDLDAVAVLRRNPFETRFALDGIYSVAHVDLRYSTTILPVPGTRRFLIANRGEVHSLADGDSWTHAVHELEFPIQVMTGGPFHVRSFITEREPRAIALSPDQQRLFVGTIQGALGGDGIVSPNWSEADAAYDGGSIVMYDFTGTNTKALSPRFAIGSPIRGMAVWKNEPGSSGTFQPQYRLYFTHVGSGAASESPNFGGRRIPNAISSILFNLSDHSPQTGSRKDVILSHCPEGAGSSAGVGCGETSHVVPEQIELMKRGESEWLWVSFSGSGNVAAIELNQEGEIHVLNGPDFDLAEYSDGGGSATNLERDTIWSFEETDAETGDSGFTFQVADPDHFNTHEIDTDPYSDDDPSGEPSPSSNPRGLHYSAVNASVSAVGRFSNTVEVFSAAHPEVHLSTWTVADVSSSDWNEYLGERRFFTAGAGFDFREATVDMKVDNLSCGTCHADGHLDGKVRITVRAQGNMPDGLGKAAIANDPSHPVAVPSVFDVGSTEWIFFEGLVTIEDRIGDGGNTAGCGYCNTQEFFLDTVQFTEAVPSPPSPYAEAQGSSLSAAAQRGRAWFDAMNCSRCHAEGANTFLRTEDTGVVGGRQNGPIFFNERVLSDPTQVFISLDATSPPNRLSLRNMTDVGTRPANDPTTVVPGVNTPSLAGAWDNGPYLHDGRYRTLDEVLEHTWVSEALGNRAASVTLAALAPDNFSNGLGYDAQSTPPDDPSSVFPFQTHTHVEPEGSGDNWASVSSHLAAQESPTAYQDLLEFLKSLSSATDPYPSTTLALTGVTFAPTAANEELLMSWASSFPAVCRVSVSLPALDSSGIRRVYEIGTSQSGNAHSVEIPLRDPETGSWIDPEDWLAEITTSYGTARISSTHDFGDPLVISNFRRRMVDCSSVLTWDTNIPVGCSLTWGLSSSPGSGGTIATSAGLHHSVTIPTSQGKAYAVTITSDGWAASYNTTFKIKFCGSFKAAESSEDGPAFKVSPNPFNPKTNIQFRLDEAGYVELKIYDIRGRVVRNLIAENRTAGQNSVIWSGKDDTGSAVASGVYYLRLRSGEMEHRAKLLLIE